MFVPTFCYSFINGTFLPKFTPSLFYLFLQSFIQSFLLSIIPTLKHFFNWRVIFVKNKSLFFWKGRTLVYSNFILTWYLVKFYIIWERFVKNDKRTCHISMCREIASNEQLNKVYVHIVSYQINYCYVSYYSSFRRHFRGGP